jgi:hypothetical protein
MPSFSESSSNDLILHLSIFNVEFLKQFLLCLQDRSLDFHALCALYAVTGNVFCHLVLGFASSFFWNPFMLFFFFWIRFTFFFLQLKTMDKPIVVALITNCQRWVT